MPENQYLDIGFAKLDLCREKRTGMGETIYCPGKTPEQLVAIFQKLHTINKPVLGTRCTPEQFALLRKNKIAVVYDATSRVVVLKTKKMPKLKGVVAVCTGGTADIPVAEEAARTVEFFGAKVERHFDVGVAGIHRLFAKLENIRKTEVVIAVAGMEGALGSVIAGLVESLVIAVPTSVGYGASFNGLAPLLTMLNSCAEGMSVVNIDNGFGAGVLACRMLRAIQKK